MLEVIQMAAGNEYRLESTSPDLFSQPDKKSNGAPDSVETVYNDTELAGNHSESAVNHIGSGDSTAEDTEDSTLCASASNPIAPTTPLSPVRMAV